MNGSPEPNAPSPSDVSRLLRASGAGDDAARQQLFEAVYAELKLCAARQLRRERQGHTLQTTALVHEAYDRMVDQKTDWNGRAHFMALAATTMRRVLVDHARAAQADKRGGDWQRVSLDVAELVPEENAHEVLELHEAIEALAAFDAEQAKLVELRFFGGYSIEETAGVMGTSPATVKREWDLARAWLHRRLKRARR
ncbi:MAG: polymerase, sigma-24 subunit, subfamily [Myxococcales bacterium]|nr:polymerase, sigma-24 subunit, subfamily [Myxococcales bacterium]